MGDYNNMIRCLWKGVADTDQQIDAADRIEELEAKLSKAVEALKYYAQDDDDGGWLAKSTLAELTGGKDE